MKQTLTIGLGSWNGIEFMSSYVSVFLTKLALSETELLKPAFCHFLLPFVFFSPLVALPHISYHMWKFFFVFSVLVKYCYENFHPYT